MRAAALLAGLLLAACAEPPADPLKPPAPANPMAGVPAPEPETPPPAPPGVDPQTARVDRAFAAAQDAPQIYMDLQPDPGGPTSVILAIDASRDETPSDDPAVRLTPDNGQCNPQQLRYYAFTGKSAGRPVYGPDEAFRGVTARELPDFMAQVVTSEMMARGLIDDPEESRPQNVCTRKLLQRMILDRSVGQG